MEYDRYNETFSMPRALYTISILSEKEKMMISAILNLSNKYLDKGGCSLGNKALAKRNRCSVSMVPNTIAKAKWLGILVNKENERSTYENKDGTYAITQKRKVLFKLPELWRIFGEIWGEFYFRGDNKAGEIIDWLDTYVKEKYKEKTEELNLIELVKDYLINFKSADFEIYKAPFWNLYAADIEDYKLLIFKKTNNNKYSAEQKETSELEEKKKSINKLVDTVLKKIDIGLKDINNLSKLNKNISQIFQEKNKLKIFLETINYDRHRILSTIHYYFKAKKDINFEYPVQVRNVYEFIDKYLQIEDMVKRYKQSTKHHSSPTSSPTPKQIQNNYPKIIEKIVSISPSNFNNGNQEKLIQNINEIQTWHNPLHIKVSNWKPKGPDDWASAVEKYRLDTPYENKQARSMLNFPSFNSFMEHYINYVEHYIIQFNNNNGLWPGHFKINSDVFNKFLDDFQEDRQFKVEDVEKFKINS